MIRMLDTNTCIYIIKQQPEVVAKKFKAFHINDIAISSIVFSELTFGVHKSQQLVKNMDLLKMFVQPINILSYDENAALHYGELRAFLQKNGISIGPLDTLIAAHALSLNATLVTNNAKEFSRIKNLRVENWI